MWGKTSKQLPSFVQFHQHYMHTFFVRKCFFFLKSFGQSQNVTREKLCKALLYEKRLCKMLMKLTPFLHRSYQNCLTVKPRLDIPFTYEFSALLAYLGKLDEYFKTYCNVLSACGYMATQLSPHIFHLAMWFQVGKNQSLVVNFKNTNIQWREHIETKISSNIIVCWNIITIRCDWSNYVG